MSSKTVKKAEKRDDFLEAAVEQSKREFSLNQNQKLFFFFVAYVTTFLPSCMNDFLTMLT
jgi:hypothetical protein